MAYIRTMRKLPSGISGWYIYHDINGKLYISSPDHHNSFHTKEDTKTIRDILTKALEEWDK